MFTEIRRKDRILENEPAVRLLEGGEYGFLAMAGVNGTNDPIRSSNK